MSNPFFKNQGPFSLSQIKSFLEITNNKTNKEIEINDIKDLNYYKKKLNVKN